MLRPIFHFSVVAINSIALWYDYTYISLPMPVKAMEDLPLKSRSMFLTFWCLIVQTIYHFIALLNDIFGTNKPAPKKSPIIRLVKDTLFSLAFTTAIYVALAFWSIYAIDKELIFPERLTKIIPPSINHIMHTTVAIFIILELLSMNIDYPSRKLGVPIAMTFLICYISWFLNIYVKTGAWVYPVFDPLSWPLRIIFIVISVIFAVTLYFVGEKLNHFVCSNRKDVMANGVSNGVANGKKRK